jgi:hypothetical protein
MKLSNRGKLTVLLIVGVVVLVGLLGVLETVQPTVDLICTGGWC